MIKQTFNSKLEESSLISAILNLLADNKAEEVVNIDLQGKSDQADNLIIASATSNRHVASLAEKVSFLVKKEMGQKIRIEGLRNADWVLIDCGDVIVHLFQQEVREFYQLDRIWLQQSKKSTDTDKI